MTPNFSKICNQILAEKNFFQKVGKTLGKFGAIGALAGGLAQAPDSRKLVNGVDVNKPAKEVYDVNKPAKDVRDKLTPVNFGTNPPSIEEIEEIAKSLKGEPEELKAYIKRIPKPILHKITKLNQEVPNSVLPAIYYASIKNDFKAMNIIAAVMYRESRFGKALNSKGTGDKGHGHGLMQIDDRSHKSFLDKGTWNDPFDNADYGTRILKTNDYIFKGNMFRALAAYNCGIGNVRKAMEDKKSAEAYTAHGDYSSKVLKYAKKFKN